MRNWREEYRNLKCGSQRRVVCVLLASIVFPLTSCRQQRVAVKERVIQAPTIRTEQVWKYKTDTLYRYETDSILIETVIHDTLIRQRVETKPLFVTVRDTVFDVQSETAKAENKRLKAENKRLKKADETARKSNIGWITAYALGTAVAIGWLWARKRKD